MTRLSCWMTDEVFLNKLMKLYEDREMDRRIIKRGKTTYYYQGIAGKYSFYVVYTYILKRLDVIYVRRGMSYKESKYFDDLYGMFEDEAREYEEATSAWDTGSVQDFLCRVGLNYVPRYPLDFENPGPFTI